MSHVSNLAAGFPRTLSQHRNFPARGFGQPGQSPQQRGLPGSVLAENRVEAAAIKLRRLPAQRAKASKLLDYILDVNDRNGRIGHRLPATKISLRHKSTGG